MGDRKRKIFSGIIAPRVTKTEGRIYAHGIPGWKHQIYFNPELQKNRIMLREGTMVEYEIGFSPRGPVAFDLRPKIG